VIERVDDELYFVIKMAVSLFKQLKIKDKKP